jgi:ABC-type amino acid transport substrate-binding protein
VTARLRAGCLAALAAGLAGLVVCSPGSARPLDVIRGRGVLTLCAHANALPFASKKLDPPGFQVELGRALAAQLGVALEVQWVTTGFQFRSADCDMVLDAIAVPEAQAERRLALSTPYQRSGVALALRPPPRGGAGFGDHAGQRVAVQVGSLAAMLLSQRGARIVPFGFEEEMVAAVARGDVAAAAVSPATVEYFNLLHKDAPLVLVHAYDAEPELRWNLAAGLRRADAGFREAIDRAIKTLVADGTVRDIYARYGIQHRPPVAP